MDSHVFVSIDVLGNLMVTTQVLGDDGVFTTTFEAYTVVKTVTE